MSLAPRRCRRCGGLLARDNADMLCSACDHQRPRNSAPEVPHEFWHTALVGAALASGDLGRVIRMYRFHPLHRQPLSQAAVAGWLHVSQATLSRIEQGRRPLTIDEIDGFTRALGVPLTLRWMAHPSEAEADVDPLSRRSLLGAGAGAALGLGATSVPAAAREIDPELVAHWMKLMSVLDRHESMFGPRDVLGAVRHELGLIHEHRQIARGELRTQLLRVESRWSQFASFLNHSTGDSRIGDAWADRALRLAHEADYPDMAAYVLMRRSGWTIEKQHDASRALAFADAALGTHGASDQIRVLCALKQAHGHALADDAAACQRSLAVARGLLDADPAVTPWGDVASREVTPASLLAEEARCWLWLAPRKAVAMFEDALRLWPHHATRRRGTEQARLALTCAAAGELDRAAAEGLKAVDIARSTRSDITVRQLKRLDRQLASCDVPAAVDFREAFAVL